MTMCEWLSKCTVMQGIVVACICLVATVVTASSAPQILDLAYQPAPFHVGSGIEVRPRLLVGETAGVAFRCRWFVNGEEIGGLQETQLPGEHFRRGDLIAVEVTPEQAGQRGRSVRSGGVEAGNAPPQILSLPPKELSVGPLRYLVEAVDADGDSLEFFFLKAPSGMQLNRESGLLTWPVEEWQAGDVVVAVAVEDGFGGQSVQRFTINVSFIQSEGQGNE